MREKIWKTRLPNRATSPMLRTCCQPNIACPAVYINTNRAGHVPGTDQEMAKLAGRRQHLAAKNWTGKQRMSSDIRANQQP